jgi:hypothetical protein
MAEVTWAGWAQGQETLSRHQALLEDATTSEILSQTIMRQFVHKAAVMDIAPPQLSELPALTLNVVLATMAGATTLGILGTKISLFDFRTRIPQKEL